MPELVQILNDEKRSKTIPITVPRELHQRIIDNQIIKQEPLYSVIERAMNALEKKTILKHKK